MLLHYFLAMRSPSLSSKPCAGRLEPILDVDDDEHQTASATGADPKIGLLSLPPEIHLEISNRLIYPDALSLKHTSRYFHNIVDTGVALKIDWLVSRRKMHLECPNDKGCDLGSDLRFCRGSVAYVSLGNDIGESLGSSSY